MTIAFGILVADAHQQQANQNGERIQFFVIEIKQIVLRHGQIRSLLFMNMLAIAKAQPMNRTAYLQENSSAISH